MKSIFTVLGVSAFALLTAACNTISGAGQDVEAAGEQIEETAESNNSY